MNKTELINAVAETSGLTKKDSETALNAILDAIQNAMKNGDIVPCQYEHEDQGDKGHGAIGADADDGEYDRVEVGKVQRGQFGRHDPCVGRPADLQYQLHDFIREIGQ